MYSTLRGLRTQMREELADVYSSRESEQLFYQLIEVFLDKSKTEVVLGIDDEISEHVLPSLKHAIERLRHHEPIQYVTQTAYFRDLVFYVDESVLIPRPETEELVSWILEEHTNENIAVLDIGTGSGIISISLAVQRPSWQIAACDVSNDALVVARRNAQEILKRGEIVLYREDILHPLTQYKHTLDLIVSNPPYVLMSDKEKMSDNVLNFEPHLALFVDDQNPLLFYEHILDYGQHNLKQGGCVYFEIHEDLAVDMQQLMIDKGYQQIEVRTDLQGKPRMARGIKALASE